MTIPGIAYVIDSGFEKVKGYNPVTGIDALVVCRRYVNVRSDMSHVAAARLHPYPKHRRISAPGERAAFAQGKCTGCTAR